MNEFLRQNYFLITYSVEILAALTGIFYFNKFKRTAAGLFNYFLIYALMVDIIGRYPKYLEYLDSSQIIEGTIFEMNYWWYLIFWNLGFPIFIFAINLNVIKNKFLITLLKYCIYFFSLSVLLYFVYDYRLAFKPSSIFVAVSSGLTIVFLCSIYFIEILITDKIEDFYKSIFFYFNSSVFVWCLIITPIVFFNIYFSSVDWNFVFLKWQIFLFANVFMYLTFTFALIFCKPEIAKSET